MNADGNLLLTIDAAAFRALIHYRDGGTMVLHAPEQLTGVIPVTVRHVSSLSAGDFVWLVRYSNSGRGPSLDIAAGSIHSIEEAHAPHLLQLLMLDGNSASPGDSGGGVWYDGQPVGNVWANGVTAGQKIGRDDSRSNSGPPLVLILAALLPLESIDAQRNARCVPAVLHNSVGEIILPLVRSGRRH